ncbi:hypothetical protein F3J23_20835 [Chryseobacterium sp. Tr-659]|uniref:hypothetical protein n=1 Tax=Chryseobacterium sp. Tr-659 TaxID=2608340 RepID=UPI00142182AE|nr:hypothetical protein [Chryseobacterium sp. Tr-659]NIF07877.1 hypothetical protein [Chryseobacterium sp. Tr-659]
MAGTVKSDNENWCINTSNYLLINDDIKLSIQEINEMHIKDNFYIALTFDLNTLEANVLQNILELKEGYELKII